FAMSVLGIGKVCVFSAVKLRLLHDGKPVANTKVKREWEWNTPNFDESVTDDDGYVFFPAVFESSLTRLLPIELVITQGLSVKIDGEEEYFWTSGKRQPEENTEYGGAKFDVICELNNEIIGIRDYRSPIVTLCKLKKGE
ncbi:MAG: DUF6795 domain-containing protein, partial [Candidatus Scalindua sp.]